MHVIANILGGLGNQMFEYAAAKRLAMACGVPLKLDIGDFEGYDLHSYGLNHLNIDAEIATRDEVWKLRHRRPWYLTKRWYRELNARFPNYRATHVRERSMAFDPKILGLQPPVYLEGYWQSEKYFADVGERLREEFQVTSAPSNPNAKKLEEIRGQKHSVCVHVRRGDYLLSSMHGLCSIDYYVEAARRLKEAVGDPMFFAFSDDPQWVADNLKLGSPLDCVDLNDASTNYEDLRLMMSCRHFIIANSSFSWWAAWLSTGRDKIVFAPKKWVIDPKVDTQDNVPDSWTRI